MNRRDLFDRAVASALLSAFFCALTLAAFPKVHARFHPDSGSPSHQCAATLIATGKCEQTNALPILFAPQAALYFEQIPALTPVWVEAPFLGARIFEHAPPALG